MKRLAPLAFAIVPVALTACLDRPLGHIEPQSTRVSVNRLLVQKVEKLDLLIVVDNSSSMKDKQSELGRRIPELIADVTKPTVDPDTGRVSQLFDVHVGVITSSLGSFGTGACHSGWYGPHMDDRAHLLPRENACGVTAGKTLSWVKDAARDKNAQFVGDTGATDLQTASSCVVSSVDDRGCGFEATWEAVYRFLADPAPYEQAKVNCVLPTTEGSYSCSGEVKVSGVDNALLAQRKAFLRDDSLLAVIVLADENDFSAKPVSSNWMPWGLPQMPRGWSTCANVPDDFEPDDGAGFALLKQQYNCTSCAIDGNDPNCKAKWPTAEGDFDHLNLHGFHQIQRYGYNTLWSRKRYVNAFTARNVLGSDGRMGTNGVFVGGKRTNDMIVVAGIVGVPQGLVMDGEKPKTLTSADWDRMISPDLSKRDPHMIESVMPRAGLRAFNGDRTVDPIHGGERVSLSKSWSDLQYACIAPRATPSGGDDCRTSSEAASNPLCSGIDQQPYFKAYPGLRHLRILHELGDSGFVGSICSESYRPAIRGITDKIKAAVNQQCIKSDIKTDDSGNASCFILESFATDTFEGKGRCEDIGKGYCTPGAAPCREENSFYPPVSVQVAATQITLPITVQSKDGPVATSTPSTPENGNLYVTGTDGKKHLLCEMRQLAGSRAPAADAAACSSDPKFFTPSVGGGWCYTTDPAVVGDRCLATGAKGKVRFLGDSEPKNGSEVFTVCVGR
jgi:hypothetical protein